jgi:hypothetical protein
MRRLARFLAVCLLAGALAASAGCRGSVVAGPGGDWGSGLGWGGGPSGGWRGGGLYIPW